MLQHDRYTKIKEYLIGNKAASTAALAEHLGVSTVTKSSKNRRTKKDSVKTLSSTLNSLNTAVLRTAVSVSVLTV